MVFAPRRRGLNRLIQHLMNRPAVLGTSFEFHPSEEYCLADSQFNLFAGRGGIATRGVAVNRTGQLERFEARLGRGLPVQRNGRLKRNLL
jgi:hypothetical protein